MLNKLTLAKLPGEGRAKGVQRGGEGTDGLEYGMFQEGVLPMVD